MTARAPSCVSSILIKLRPSRDARPKKRRKKSRVNGTAGKLLTDEALYNDARAAIARFNTAAERIDNVVAGVQRGEGTAGKLLTDEQLYNNVNQLSAESVKLIYDFRQNPKKYLTIKFSLF